MRLLTIAAVQLAATVALACPNLAGKYECNIDTEHGQTLSVQIDISQAGNTFNIGFSIAGQNMTVVQIADGVERLDKENSDEEMNIYTTNTCTQTKLVSSDRQELKTTEDGLVRNDSVTVMSLNKDGDLVSKITNTTYFDTDTEVETEVEVCKKI